MKITNRIFSTILAFSLVLPVFSMSVYAEAPVLSYTFSDETTSGIADGTITLSGISDIKDTITGVNLYWGSSEATPLDGYANIKSYTVNDITKSNYNKTKLEYTDDGSLVLEISGSKFIPEGANYLVAEITTTEETTDETTSETTSVTSTQTVSAEIPEAKKNNYENPLYTMFWISDLHSVFSSFVSGSQLDKTFADIQQIAATDGDLFKGVIANGDIANSAWDYEYEIVEDFIDKYQTGKPVYYNTGNHDTATDNNGGRTAVAAEAIDTRFKKLKTEFGLEFDRRDDWSYDTYIEGQHYIFLSLPYYSKYELTDEQMAWLEEKLCEDEKSGVPTYVFCHMPYPNTVAKTASRTVYHESFPALVDRHPGMILITSHIHLEFDNDQETAVVNKVIDGATEAISVVDTSSASDTYLSGVGSDNQLVTRANGRYVQVYEDKVVIRARNFLNGTWIPRAEYVIPIDRTKVFDGGVSISGWSSDGITAGSELTAKINGEDIDTDKYTYNWYIDGTVVGTENTAYTVETENKDVAVKVVDNETGAYAYAVTDYRAPAADAGDGDETTDTEITFDGNTQVLFYNNILNISGTVDASYAGKDATFVLIPKATYTDLSTAEYINDCTIGTDGSYKFKFKADAQNLDDDYVLLFKVDSGDITKNEVVPRTTEVLVQFSAEYDAENGNVNISAVNNFLDETDAQAVMAAYLADNRFSSMTVSPFKLAFGENGETQSAVIGVQDTGSFIKAMLLTDLVSMKPLAQSFDVEIPEQETE